MSVLQCTDVYKRAHYMCALGCISSIRCTYLGMVQRGNGYHPTPICIVMVTVNEECEIELEC